MLKLIHRAIARITQAIQDAMSTQPAGHAPQDRTIQTGKAPSVSAATKRQPQSAQSKPKRKPSVAKPTTAVASRKVAPKPAQTTSGKTGRPRKTVA
jgi:hypothetical protein